MFLTEGRAQATFLVEQEKKKIKLLGSDRGSFCVRYIFHWYLGDGRFAPIVFCGADAFGFVLSGPFRRPCREGIFRRSDICFGWLFKNCVDILTPPFAPEGCFLLCICIASSSSAPGS